jgi:hypothetical protein
MSDDGKIEQETWIPHEGMGIAIKEWAEAIELAQLPTEAQELLMQAFRDGWGGCLHHTMAPSRDLAMMLLQIVEVSKKPGQQDFKVVLGGQALEFIEEMAHKIVGLPADWQLDDIVEAVQVDLENPPEDLPDEVVEELRKVKEGIAKEGTGDPDAGDS